MYKYTFLFVVLLLAIACNWSQAQSDDFRHGYIFEQSYVKRIPLSKAEQLINVESFFTPFTSADWSKEKIKDARISRAGTSLSIQFSGKTSLNLRDFTMKASKEMDGEYQRFRYLRNVAHFHLIGVEFGHDQPTFLLVDYAGRDIYFIDM
nr:hypothetical protein [uncultured Undibacterium sp.]